jgi:adenosylhomocysteine nucleosidase
MKIGIISAMQEEHDSIIKILGIQHTISGNGVFLINQGKYLDHDIYCLLSGIGKVNVAMNTQHLVSKVAPDIVINVGVAGSLSEKLNFGDVVIADDLVQHDVDVKAFGLPLGQIPRMDTFAFPACKELLKKIASISSQDYTIHVGRIISGDQFINDKATATFLFEHFNALACEMEGAAVAHVCHRNSVPFAVVRALSDMAGQEGEATSSYIELKGVVASRSSFIVEQLLNQL